MTRRWALWGRADYAVVMAFAEGHFGAARQTVFELKTKSEKALNPMKMHNQ